MKKEAEYTIMRRLEWRISMQQEYFYTVRRGSMKVGEVWLRDASMKSFYDQRGRSACAFSITDTGTKMAAHSNEMVAYLILLNAYDWKTAEAWYKEVAAKLRMPTNVHVRYKKADIFSMILESQQAKVAVKP